MRFTGFRGEKLVVSKVRGDGHDHLLIQWEDGTHWYLHLGTKTVTVFSGRPTDTVCDERPAIKAYPHTSDMIIIQLA